MNPNDRSLRRRQLGFSLIELLIVIAIILIIAAMALPKLNKARMSAFEAGAIKSITTIHTAQTQYYSQFGRYAKTLGELGPPSSGNPGAASADLLPQDLSLGVKGGYKFRMQVTETGYTVNADPDAYNNTGSRSFYSDQALTIRNNYGPEPATVTSPEIK